MALFASVYNTLLFNHIRPQIEKIQGKIGTAFKRIVPQTSDNLLDYEKSTAKPLSVNILKAFDSIQRVKMEQILLAYGLPKEILTAIVLLYKNTKATVCSPDGNIVFFDIVTGVLQGNILASYLFIHCLDYLLWISINLIKENGFTLKKTRSW